MKKVCTLLLLSLLVFGLASCDCENKDCDAYYENGEYWFKTTAVFHILNTNTDLYPERIDGYGSRAGIWLKMQDGTKVYLSNGSYVSFGNGYCPICRGR